MTITVESARLIAAHKRGSNRGFTLLEVVTALALLAFSLAALWKGLEQSTQVAQGLPARIVARWVAQNHLVMRQAREEWPAPRTLRGTEKMNGQTWYWTERVEQTDEAMLRRMTVEVATAARSNPLVSVEGYLARPRR